MNNKNNYVAIMAGGIGSRFWPESRTSLPKQFLDLLGTGKSLIQWTYQRFLHICPLENIYFITNHSYIDTLKAQIPEIADANIISAPVRFGNRLAFGAFTPNEGSELWVSDGTAAGTAAITNFNAAGVSTVHPGTPTPIGQYLYFLVSLNNATQLARTDGTLAGMQVLTSFSGQQTGLLDRPVRAGGQILFTATDGLMGYELYVQPNVVPVAADDAATVTAGQPVTINLVSNDADGDGRVVASRVRIVGAPGNGTATVDSAGVATYRGNAGFSGADSFTYVVEDDVGAESAPAVVRVTVNAAPAPPAPPSPAPSGGGGGGNLGVLLILMLGGLRGGLSLRRPAGSGRA